MISDLQIFIKYRISMFFLLWFMLEFMPLRYSRKKSILICLGCFLLTSLVDYFHINMGPNHPVLYFKGLFSDILIALVQGTALMLSRYRDWRALFVGITASAFVLSGDMMWNVTAMLSGSFILSYIVQIGIHLSFLLLFIKELRKQFLLEVEHAEDHWFNLCLVPAIMYLLVYTVVFRNEDSYAHLDVDIPVILEIIVLMLASFVLLIRSFRSKDRDMELAHENLMMKNYTAAVKHESETIRQKEEKYAVARHDIRHMNNMLRAYLNAGQIDQAKELLNTLDERLDQTVTIHYCSNVAVDGILLSCAERARHLGVAFQCQAEVPERMEHVDDYDLGSAIANLTENAINAASDQRIPEKDRVVKVSMRIIKSQLAVQIENPYAGELTIDQRTGLPLSHGGELHGYGLRSVQLHAEKKHSIFRYSTEGHIFRVQLLINC